MPTKLIPRVIYTGGTLGMLPSPTGLIPAPHLEERLKQALDTHWPELSFCELNPLLDSSVMHSSHWFRLAAQILTEAPNYSCFIIIHGTDTLAWSAAALTYLTQNINKPVVLTASQLPLGVPNSDALANFTFALEQAPNLAAGCYLAMQQQILPATRTRKFSSSSLKAFQDTCPEKPLTSQPVNWPQIDLNPQELTFLAANWQPKVTHLPLTPSLNDAWLAQSLQNLDGVIFSGLGAGNSPNLPLTFNYLNHKKSVYTGLVSQCWHGGVSGTYAASAELTQAGVLSLGSLTPENAEVRLVILLALRQLEKISSSQILEFWPEET